jgi:tetratricopeptide (TPR) repeat protein
MVIPAKEIQSEEQPQDGQPVKDIKAEESHLDGHGVKEIQPEEGHLDGHNIKEIQADEGHLNGHSIQEIQTDESHLNGHSVKDIQPDETHLDAHSAENTQSNKEEVSIENLLLEGKKHMEEGEIEKALVCFDRVLEFEPHHLDAWSLKGDALLRVGKNKPSIEKLVIEGREHLQKKDFEKALLCFDRALELDPHHLDAWSAKGDALLEKEKNEKD